MDKAYYFSRKNSSFFLIVIAVSLIVTSISCSKKESRPKNPEASLRLALRAGLYSQVIQSCLSEFEINNNIICEIDELSENDLYSSVENDAINKNGKYDFCMVDSSWMAEYTANGVLTELSSLGYKLDDDIIPATKTICYTNDGLYLAPYYGNVTVLLYNKIMLKEAGYTPEKIQSLEDLLYICNFQKKRHNLGFIYRGDTANNTVVDFLPILCSRGIWLVDENNKPTINQPAFSEAIYFYLDLIETGRAAPKEDLIAAIANKSAAMGVGWPGWYTPTKNSSMDYLAFTGKFRDDRPAYNSNIYGIWAVGIPSNSTKKDYAIKLLSYLMDKDVQKDTVIKGGVPCRYSSLKDPEILKKFPQYEVVCKALEGGIYRPVMKEWNEFYTILGRELNLIIKEGKLVRTALEDAQRDLEIMLSKSETKN
ncbi:MAG: extracellular solute-binding protein [Treponema sp.]|nr:extracellular solute-binding protein [Treponema sp.]